MNYKLKEDGDICKHPSLRISSQRSQYVFELKVCQSKIFQIFTCNVGDYYDGNSQGSQVGSNACWFP